MNLDPSAFVADPELLEGLVQKSSPISCIQETVLFQQGDSATGLFILKSGPATLQMTSPANSNVLSFEANAGSLLGLPAVIGDVPYTLTAIAHPGAELGYISRETFTETMQLDGPVALKVLRVLAAEVRSARGAILEQSAEPPRRRKLTPSRRA